MATLTRVGERIFRTCPWARVPTAASSPSRHGIMMMDDIVCVCMGGATRGSRVGEPVRGVRASLLRRAGMSLYVFTLPPEHSENHSVHRAAVVREAHQATDAPPQLCRSHTRYAVLTRVGMRTAHAYGLRLRRTGALAGACPFPPAPLAYQKEKSNATCTQFPPRHLPATAPAQREKKLATGQAYADLVQARPARCCLRAISV